LHRRAEGELTVFWGIADAAIEISLQTFELGFAWIRFAGPIFNAGGDGLPGVVRGVAPVTLSQASSECHKEILRVL
jgi:hypothetical protein